MSTCNKQKLSPKAIELIAKATKNGQDLKFNNLQITTTEFDGSVTLREAFVKLFSDNTEDIYTGLKRIKESLMHIADDTSADGRFDVIAKMGLLFKDGSNDKGILGILNRKGNKSADTLVEDSIAMQIVLDSIQSESDTQASSIANNDVAANKVESLNLTGVPTSYLRLAPTIGRAIAIARGKVLNGGLQANHSNYAKMGASILERLVAEDLLLKDDNGEVVFGAIKTSVGDRKSGVVQTTAIRVNEKTFKDYIPASVDERRSSSDLLKVLKQLSRITTPYTELAPKNEASTETKTAHNKFQVESTTETLKNIQAGAMGLSPSITAFMEYLHSIYKAPQGDKTFEASLKEEFGIDDEYEFLEEVFGITVAKGDFTDESDAGKKTSRMGPLVGLMQNYSALNVEKFFFTYKQAHNSRFFQRESILDVQADKKMARNLIESSYEFTYEGTEIDDLVSRIGVEYGVPRDVIKGINKDNAYLEGLLKWLDEGSPEAQRNILKQVSNKAFHTGIDSTNPWVIHKALRAISDVRKGLNSADGKVTSRMMLESDASGSGPVLKLLQNMHNIKAVNVLKRLGLIRPVSDAEMKALGGPLLDFYQLANETFVALADKAKGSANGIPLEFNAATSDIDKVLAIMKISGHGTDFRSFIKDPIIRFTYEQTTTENIKETAKVLAEGIVLQGFEQVNAAIDALSIKKDPRNKARTDPNKDHYTERLTREQQEEAVLFLTKALQADVAKFMVKDILEPTYSKDMFDGTKVAIDKIFEVINKQIGTGAKDEGITYKFMEPAVVLDWLDRNPTKTVEDFPYAANRKYRLIGDKRFETKLGHGEEQQLIPLYHANVTSAHILPIHALDAAILIRAIAKVYKDVNKIPGLEGLTPDNISILMIHDAAILPPKIAHLVEEAYEQEIINSSMNYDVVYMMLKEAAFKASLKIQEALIKKGVTDAKFVEMDLDTLALKYPDLGRIIQKNAVNRKGKFDTLNVTPNGKVRKIGEDLATMPYSFATNLEDTEFTKKADPKNPSAKDGVDIAYDKRRSKNTTIDAVAIIVKEMATEYSDKPTDVAITTTVNVKGSFIRDPYNGEFTEVSHTVEPKITTTEAFDRMPPVLKHGIIIKMNDQGLKELKALMEAIDKKCKG